MSELDTIDGPSPSNQYHAAESSAHDISQQRNLSPGEAGQEQKGMTYISKRRAMS